MSCLTINFARHLEFELQSRLLIPLVSVSTVMQGSKLLEDSDFSCVIEDARQVDGANADLAHLLAITPVCTRIIALVSTRTVPDPDYWQAQGAILLYEPNEDVLVNEILKCCTSNHPV